MAQLIAFGAHSEQLDKAGRPYMEHLRAVANQIEGDEAKTVAYLHDIVEDTKWRLEDLSAKFPPRIVDAIDCLTRRPGESYSVYIQRVEANPLAKVVKIADLRHNLDLSRLINPAKADHARVKKYMKALETLTGKEKS